MSTGVYSSALNMRGRASGRDKGLGEAAEIMAQFAC